MSIRDIINDWCGQSELFLLTPVLDSDPIERVLFVSRDIYAAVTDLGDGVDERMGRLRAHLEVFVRGDVITIAMDPYRAGRAYMARLQPRRDEIWEIRDRSSPSIRVFGSFTELDTFVALTWQWRSILGAPLRRARDTIRKIAASINDPARQPWPRMWQIEQRACKAEWRKKFPAHNPHNGSTPDDYITNWLPVGDPNRWQS
jgi:hypothetical protein